MNTPLGKSLFDHFKRLSGHTLSYTFGNVSVRFLSLLLLPLYTRFLSPQDYGVIYAMLITSFFVGIILDLRQNASVLRIYYDYKDEPEKLRRYLGSVFIFSVIFSLLVIGLLLLTGKELFGFLFADIPFFPYVVITLAFTFFKNTLTFPMILFRVREQPMKYSLYSISQFLLTNGLIVYFVVFLKKGAVGYITANLYVAILFFIIYLVLALKEIDLNFSLTLIKPGLKYGIPLIPLALSTWVIQGSDRFFLAKYSTLANVGLYSIAYNLASGIGMIGFSISQAWQPMFYAIAKDRDEANRIFPSLSSYFLLSITVLVLIASYFSKEVLLVLTGPEFHSAYYIIPIIASIYIFDSIFNISAHSISFLKKTHITSVINTFAALINIFLNYLWVPEYGMKGAAYGTLIAYISRACMAFAISQKLYGLNYEFKRVLPMMGLGFIFLQVGIYMNTFTISIKTIFIKLVLMLGFIGCLYIARFFSAGELERIKGALVFLIKASVKKHA